MIFERLERGDRWNQKFWTPGPWVGFDSPKAFPWLCCVAVLNLVAPMKCYPDRIFDEKCCSLDFKSSLPMSREVRNAPCVSIEFHWNFSGTFWVSMRINKHGDIRQTNWQTDMQTKFNWSELVQMLDLLNDHRNFSFWSLVKTMSRRLCCWCRSGHRWVATKSVWRARWSSRSRYYRPLPNHNKHLHAWHVTAWQTITGFISSTASDQLLSHIGLLPYDMSCSRLRLVIACAHWLNNNWFKCTRWSKK